MAKKEPPVTPEEILKHLQEIKDTACENDQLDNSLILNLEKLEDEMQRNRMQVRYQRRSLWLMMFMFFSTNAVWFVQFVAEKRIQESEILDQFSSLKLIPAEIEGQHCIYASTSGEQFITPYDVISNGIARVLANYGYGFCEPGGSLLNLTKLNEKESYLVLSQPDVVWFYQRQKLGQAPFSVRELEGFYEALFISSKTLSSLEEAITKLKQGEEVIFALPAITSGGAITGLNLAKALFRLADEKILAKQLEDEFADLIRNPEHFLNETRDTPLEIQIDGLHLLFVTDGKTAHHYAAQGKADIGVSVQYPGLMDAIDRIGQKILGVSLENITEQGLTLLDLPETVYKELRFSYPHYSLHNIHFPNTEKVITALTLTPTIYGSQIKTMADKAAKLKMTTVYQQLQLAELNTLLGVKSFSVHIEEVVLGEEE